MGEDYNKIDIRQGTLEVPDTSTRQQSAMFKFKLDSRLPTVVIWEAYRGDATYEASPSINKRFHASI